MTDTLSLSILPYLSNPELREEVLEYSYTLTVAKGETIIREGQYLKVLPIVLKGSIRVFHRYEDREALLYYVGAGETCVMSLTSCFFNIQSKSFAITEEETEILCIPASLVKGWQPMFPEWNEFVIGTFRNRYEELLHSFNSVIFNNIETRILEILKFNSEKKQSQIIHYTHLALANELGTTRVVVSRILKKFEQEGMVELLRGGIKIIKL